MQPIFEHIYNNIQHISHIYLFVIIICIYCDCWSILYIQ